MKNLVSFICLLPLLLVSGCSEEEVLKNDSTSASGEGRTFTTSFEQNGSRTYLENGLYSRWTEGDRISLFDGNTLNREYKFDGKTGDNTGTFSIVNNKYGTGSYLSTNYAIYPYSGDVKITDSGVITATLPALQHYAENSYGLGNNTMVAVTHNVYDTFLKFKSVGGCLKLQFYGNDVTIKSITLTGNNGEKIAGKADIIAAYDKAPVVTMAEDATTSITLDCGEGVKANSTQEGATTFWIALPPVTFKKGFTATVMDVDGKVFTQTTSKELTIERNVVNPMAAVEVKPQNVEIPYLTFTADASQTLTMSLAIETLQYSVGDSEWKELGTNTVTFGGSKGDLRLRGKNLYGTIVHNGYYEDDFEDSTIGFGDGTVPVACSGDIRTLLDYENYLTVNTEKAIFSSLFEDCVSLTSAPELPATVLARWCYDGMFSGCTNLTQAPELPATTLAYECYQDMFNGCISLTQAPELPATTLAEDCYESMFADCTGLTQAPELPATTLADGCYGCMFAGCVNLAQAPELPATTLADYCYGDMFHGCTSLTQAPELPATTLTYECYEGMFRGCTGLVQAPELPATILANSCYKEMFADCTGLTKAPELPAATLADGCYNGMFSNCAGLLQSPELPATTLSDGCYAGMFEGCTSLTQAPELPVTALARSCYGRMFYGCTSLTQAPELPATNLTEFCYEAMFENCTKLTQAPSLPASTLTVGCYYHMFTGCTSLTQAPKLPAATLADMCYYEMFYGCKQLNSITMLATDITAHDCLYYWVEGVASEGTFVKAKEMLAYWGVSGIPFGWTVEDYEEF